MPRRMVLFSMFAISLVPLLESCAHRQAVKAPAPAALAIPVTCISDVQTPETGCIAISPDVAECNHVRVKFECVKARSDQHGK